jgi:hypothetical protein
MYTFIQKGIKSIRVVLQVKVEEGRIKEKWESREKEESLNGERGRCKSLRRGAGSFQEGERKLEERERKFEEFEEIEWNLDERQEVSGESEEVS